MHRSLLVRMLAASVLIAVCAVAATAWLAARTTTSAIQQEQGQVLSDDADIYDTLVGYAATHPDWAGVKPTLRKLAKSTGRQITLTTQHRRPIARSSAATGSGPALPTKASAVVDPLHADSALLPGAEANSIDPRAIGPYRLSTAEYKQLHSLAKQSLACLKENGFAVSITEAANGHPSIAVGDNIYRRKVAQECGALALEEPSATENKALTRLSDLARTCLTGQKQQDMPINLDFTPTDQNAVPAVQTCIDTAHRDQLVPYVAPAALLFVTTPAGATTPAFHLSPANTARIAGAAALVLVLTVAVTVAVGTRLVRPLRALTDAARRPAQEHLRVPVTTNDEIGYLAAAFNDLSERRERMEDQRKAMVSDVAHELRTPLSTIRSWLEAAQDGIATSDQAFVSSLLEEALLLQHIVDDLQDLAAADAGKLRIHPEPLYVRDLLDQVATAHRSRAETGGVILTTRTEGEPELCGDPVRLRQAVGNLVSNAVRHTPPGGSVTLRARDSGNRITIEVADTGSGIAAEDLPHVFDRFWRAEKSRNRQTGGSGLGLAIVRQLTEAHAGTVTVASTPGAGTVFTLRLPG
ncbi:sensor histidine kinase [Streptomyces prunicolor]|uniref:histidine kinase n=1 Tax=Streptomyces prunicolor TaxID=67348 RepID=A0ABU4FBY3_9ACTN|nr:HAMP domain-containing sensor histidine kinase [Streptomyces prunicolor]MDV7216800.1 HAMP domain-containing sensor histidine kinase [Streptomyces prunicolor]